MTGARRQPPALIVKSIAVTFVTTALLLAGVFVAVIIGVRNEVRRGVRQQLETTQRLVGAVQDRELRDLHREASAATESPTLKAAVDTYGAESHSADSAIHAQLLNTIGGEVAKLAAVVDADAVLVVDGRGTVLASAGADGARWRVASRIAISGEALSRPAVLKSGGDIFRVVAAPLIVGDGSAIGMLLLATKLDAQFARSVSTLANVPTVIVSDGTLIASTLPAENGAAAEDIVGALREGSGTLRLARESYEYRELLRLDGTSVYAIQSVDHSASRPIAAMNKTLAVTGAAALVIALAASVWLAHLFGAPIGALSQALSRMAASKSFRTQLEPSGSSRELDRLTETFNTLMGAVEAANEETALAYTSAIRALAAALDARDPYTAGHSERVSTLSVAIGREMGLPDHELEVLRLGALLHDIGKIGVPDSILLKPGRLTEEEFAVIRQHPTLGARILKNVPFLAPHLPIVELHHERPDGGGYPHGLRQQDIPLAAHIVHVADAYDAMTSARSYRRERPTTTALRELWAGAGTEFHADAVAALAKAIPGLAMVYETPLEALSA